MPNGQEGFVYSNDHLSIIEKYLSPERLAEYFTLAKGKRFLAIKFYERNTELSEALYGVIQGFEVTLRNAIHELLKKQIGHDNWYEHIPLEQPELNSLQEAREKITGRGYAITAPRMIAELTFGFWVRLVAATYEKTLWVPHLHRIFPIRMSRRTLYVRLDKIKKFRNRIAHHERIIRTGEDLPTIYEEIMQALGWLSPVMQAWVRSTNCFTQRWERKVKVKNPLDAPAPIEKAAAIEAPHEQP
jgi:hypothetical protein